MLIGSWDSTAIGTNSPCDDSPTYLTTLLDAANSALMINNYHNYMTYFLVCSYKTLQVDILTLFTYIFYLHLFFFILAM